MDRDARPDASSALIVALTAFYIVLGCFLDGISMVVLTMGVIMPTVQKAGIDLLWFGIFIVSSSRWRRSRRRSASTCSCCRA